MKDRLKQLRQELGLNQEEFAKALKIGRSTIANYEAGTRVPISSVISLICKNWNVNETWLSTGEGEMFIEEDPEDELLRLANELAQDTSAEMKRRLVTAMLRLSPEQIETAIEWMRKTLAIVDAPAADQEAMPAASAKKKPSEEMTIDEKVASYRAELEAEEAARMSGASPAGEGDEAVKDA